MTDNPVFMKPGLDSLALRADIAIAAFLDVFHGTT
jgi:hypothetical protein